MTDTKDGSGGNEKLTKKQERKLVKEYLRGKNVEDLMNKYRLVEFEIYDIIRRNVRLAK